MSDTILAKDRDTWGNENYGLPCGLYFYFLNEHLPGWETEKSGTIVGNCPGVQSVQYTPFIDIDDLTMFHVPYDTQRFGSIDDLRPGLTDVPNVFRIMSIDKNIKTLGTFKCYSPVKNIGGKKHWRNESRLYNYPYAFAMLTDNLNTPIEIKYHLCKNNVNEVKVRNTISDRCSYGLFIEGYKGDSGGKMESMVSSDAHELPCSSSAYTQWVASSKNQVTQNVLNNNANVFIQNSSLQKQLLPNLISQGTFSPSNLIQSLGGMYSTGLQNKMQQDLNTQSTQNLIASAMAQSKDMNSIPNTMISMGSNVYYGLDKGEKKVNLYRFGLTDEYYQKLGDYFAMYGYKQNKVMEINLRSRYYYNYIKTVGANITGTLPRNILEQIQVIFDNGVTIWHIDNEGVKVLDYSNDNREV